MFGYGGISDEPQTIESQTTSNNLQPTSESYSHQIAPAGISKNLC